MPRQPLITGAAAANFSRSTDKDIVVACLAGNESAWDALIDRYQSLIYSIPLRMRVAETDAQDIFQTVCLLLLNHLEDVRDVDRLAGWLALTTRRETWRFLRRRGEAPTLGSELEDAEWQFDNAAPVGPNNVPSSRPDAVVMAAEEQHLVRQGLIQLADRCRDLLTLLYCTDPPASYADASQRLKIPLGSIGPQRARCLERLQKVLIELGF